jgi:hypothetical protein
MPAFASGGRLPATSNQVIAGNVMNGFYTTWHARYHRTMTREAEPGTVLGDFDHNNAITYQGIVSS